LYYYGPKGRDQRLCRKIRFFRLDRARRFGSDLFEPCADFGIISGDPKQPDVFLTALDDPIDYVRADVVAVEVRTPSGLLLEEAILGTAACYYLTPDSVAAQAAAVARGSGNHGAQPRTDGQTNNKEKMNRTIASWQALGWAPIRGKMGGMDVVMSKRMQNRELIAGLVVGPLASSRKAGEYVVFAVKQQRACRELARKSIRRLPGGKTVTQKFDGVTYDRAIYVKGTSQITVLTTIQDGRCVAYWYIGPTSQFEEFRKVLGRAVLPTEHEPSERLPGLPLPPVPIRRSDSTLSEAKLQSARTWGSSLLTWSITTTWCFPL
jgi:hypothetical protein